MLTRHFYNIEDASAALQYAIHKKKPYEAVYYAKELFEYKEVLQKTLFMSWFYSIGLSDINCIKHIKNPSLEFVFKMASSESRNSTLFYMFMNGALHKEYKTKKSLIKLSKSLIQENQNIDAWIRNTLFSKYLESWQISLKIWDDDSFIPMVHQFILTKFDNPTLILEIIEYIYEIEYVDILYRRCAIIGILCMNDCDINTSFDKSDKSDKSVTCDLNLYLEYWNSVYGKRKGRVYTLHNECFYGKTKRGTMKKDETNIQELYDPIRLIQNQTIYKEILNVFETFEAFQNDYTQYEAFFDYYFCDDIPEEWSLEQQMRSHGYGVLEKDEKPNLQKYVDTWIDDKAKNYIENPSDIITQYSKKYVTDTYDFEDSIMKKYVLNETSLSMKSLQTVLDTL